jgi:FtsH ternary system domain X1
MIGEGVPPQGDVSATELLAHPPYSLRLTLIQLTTTTAARLQYSQPPLGDSQPVGIGVLLIAAAIGSLSVPELVNILLMALPVANSANDLVARHGVVFPTLKFVSADMAEDFRLASPLTAVLDRPAREQVNESLKLAQKILRYPVERAALVNTFAQPTTDIQIRNWRQDLLDRWRLGAEAEQKFVLDVYEAMMIQHSDAVMRQIRAARTTMTTPEQAQNDQQLQAALSVARWWGPLWTMERSDIDALRTRRYLGYEYREGLDLYRLSQRLTRGL